MAPAVAAAVVAGNEPTRPSQYPNWYSPETGIYHSKYPSVNLPSQRSLDVVSFIFSHKHNGVTALTDSSSGFSVSYADLLPLVKSMAAGLHQFGVKQGDVVVIVMPNSVYLPIIFLGAMSIGAIVSPMNPMNNAREVKAQVVDTNAKLVISVMEKVDDLVSALGSECQVIGVPEYIANRTEQSSSAFHKLINCDPAMAPSPNIMQNDTAAILYSSGTTGKAKGVILTHGNMIAMVELFVRFEASLYDYPSTENVYLAVLPMFHVYGMSLFVMGLLSLGTSVVVMRKFDGDQMVEAIDKYGVTHLPVVPPLIKYLIMKGMSKRFRSLKQVSSGAAPLSKKIIEDFTRAFPHVDFIQGYGLTESSAVGTRGHNIGKVVKHMSVGNLSPNSEAKVVDWVTGSCLSPGGIGELWLRSPGITKGYLHNIEATKAAIDKDGWLHTGDLVYFDQEGYLYVVDRLKEVIKYKGYQVAPADLEAVLVSHPGVVDAAVTAEMDEEAGEIPVAFVVRKDGSVTINDLMHYVANKVAPYKKVRKVYFRPSIPRSAAGKILRRELRTLLTSKI